MPKTTPKAVMEVVIERCDDLVIGVANAEMVKMSEVGAVAEKTSDALLEVINGSDASPLTVVAGILTALSAMLGAFLCTGMGIEPEDYMKSKFGEDWTPPEEE